jgi:hypothetical protein
MTTGSWSVGHFGTGSMAALKQWSGSDGKTEPWNGGTRTKWNNYTMLHRKMTQSVTNGFYLTEMQVLTAAQIGGIVGWSSNDDLRMLNKLAERVRGHSFDLGINIAEAKKSYGTIMSNLQSVGSALRNLKRGRFGDAARDLGRGKSDPRFRPQNLNSKDLSGRWLETQYAFMPLVSQAYEAGKALEAVTKPRGYRFSAGSGTKRATMAMSNSPTVYSTKMYLTYSKRVTAELREPLALNRSLGLTNPLEIAWEVVPYSFVVDWFLPVGSYLSAWGVIPALTGRFMTTERAAIKRGPTGRGSNPTSNTYLLYVAGNRKESLFRTTRTGSTSLSIPRPTFNRLPRALSPRRLLSAISLIHQRLR